jgi:hypothetical protein
MGIVDTLKADHATAKDASADRDFMVLEFVLEQVAKIGRNDGNREVTDAEALTLIRKIHKDTVAALATALTNAEATGAEAINLPIVTPLGIELMHHKVAHLAGYIPADIEQDEAAVVAYLDATFPDQLNEADSGEFATAIVEKAVSPTGAADDADEDTDDTDDTAGS